MYDFWVPKTRAELLKWLKMRYKTGLNNLTKKQLYAIYYRERLKR